MTVNRRRCQLQDLELWSKVGIELTRASEDVIEEVDGSVGREVGLRDTLVDGELINQNAGDGDDTAVAAAIGRGVEGGPDAVGLAGLERGSSGGYGSEEESGDGGELHGCGWSLVE